MPWTELTWDNGTADTVETRSVSGEVVSRPVRASADEMREREAGAWRRALEGVEWRLEHVGETWPHEPPLNRQQLASKRAELERERERCLSELARLEQAT